MSYRVKKGKEKTFVSGFILGDCSPGDLQRFADLGDLRFIEEAPEEKKPKRKPKEKDKETEEDES